MRGTSGSTGSPPTSATRPSRCGTAPWTTPGCSAPAELLAAARQWFTAQTIVVGHANHPTVTTLYGELLALIAERGLRTVTLADVWATPAQRLRGAVANGEVLAS